MPFMPACVPAPGVAGDPAQIQDRSDPFGRVPAQAVRERAALTAHRPSLQDSCVALRVAGPGRRREVASSRMLDRVAQKSLRQMKASG